MAKQLRSGGWLDLLSWGEVSDIYLSAELLLPSHSPQLNIFQGFLSCFMKKHHQGTILSSSVPGTVWVISESPDVASNLVGRVYQSQESGKQSAFLCWWTHILIKLLACFSSVQTLSHIWLFATPWTAACQASLSITNSWTLLKLMSIKPVMPSNHLILCHPLFLPPSIFPSIRVLSNESVLRIRWPKYWSFSLSISPANEYSGLISFRMDWFDLLAVQGTLKSLLQHHSSKASNLQHSAFFIVQLSHPYITTGKTIALITWTFVGKVMFLLFNMLSRLVITFLPRSKCLNFMATVTVCSDFGAPQSKVCHCFPIYLPWSDGTSCHDLSFLNVEGFFL